MVFAAIVATWTGTHAPVVMKTASVAGVGVDKWAHAALYAAIAWLLAGSLRSRPVDSRLRRFRLIATFAIVALLGAADEWTQGLVPLRERSLGDWVFNLLGAASALVGIALWNRLVCTHRPDSTMHG